MKSLYLHVGLQKTGTSSVQMLLMRPGSPLVELGIDYLPDAIAPANAHHNAAYEAAADHRYDPRLPGLDSVVRLAQASVSGKIFVSSESFCLLTGKQVRDLARRLQPFAVKPIICLRNQLNWTESVYAQACKRGTPGSFEEFSLRMSEGDRLNFLKLFETWSSTFGAQNTTVMVYENYPDIAAEFARFFGARLNKAAGRKNKSLNERFVAASQQVLNRCRQGKLSHNGMVIPVHFTPQVAKHLLAIGARQPQFSGSPIFLSRADAQVYLDQFREINRQLALIAPLPLSYFEVPPDRPAPKPRDPSDAECLVELLFASEDIRRLTHKVSSS